MPLTALIPLIALLAIAAAGFIYYAIVLFRVRVAAHALPTARDGLNLPEPERRPPLCIVVPAHNEQDVIQHLIRSLRAQSYNPLHTVLVLDRCTDNTETVARNAAENDPRITILTNDHCPDDWAGKTHAIHRGVSDNPHAQAAQLLLFADADTHFHPDAVEATVRLLLHRKLDMLSLLTTLSRDAWYERVIQPATGFELVRQFPLDLVNKPNSNRAFANGQFMLFRREAYESIGGHERVRDALLEDLAFASQMARRKINRPVGVLMADGMVECRMYRSIDAYNRGWKRIFTEAAKRKPDRLRIAARRLILTGAILPLAAAAALATGATLLALNIDPPLAATLTAVGALALIQTLITLAAVYHSQHARIRDVIHYPRGAIATARILRDAAKDLETGVATTWGGREYARKVRS